MDIFYIGEWLYKAPFKSFIPDVLTLIQMGENHKFFSLVINFVQMFEPTVVQQKKSKFFALLFWRKLFNFSQDVASWKSISGLWGQFTAKLYNHGKGDVDHCLNCVVFLICSCYWISIEIFMVIVDKAATIYGSDTRSSREVTSAWSQEWCTCKVFFAQYATSTFPIMHLICPSNFAWPLFSISLSITGILQWYEWKPEKFGTIQTETSIMLLAWHHIVLVGKFSVLTWRLRNGMNLWLVYYAPINGLPKEGGWGDGGGGQPTGIGLTERIDILNVPRVGNLTRPSSWKVEDQGMRDKRSAIFENAQ